MINSQGEIIKIIKIKDLSYKGFVCFNRSQRESMQSGPGPCLRGEEFVEHESDRMLINVGVLGIITNTWKRDSIIWRSEEESKPPRLQLD